MSTSGGVTNVSTSTLGAVTELDANSGIVAAAAAVATLPAAAGKTTFIDGFEVTAAGSTAALAVTVTVGGPAVPLTYVFVFPAGAGVGAAPLVVEFPRPIPASAPNTAITVTCPSGGAGNTAASVVAHGYQQ